MDELGPLIHGSYEDYLLYFTSEGLFAIKSGKLSSLSMGKDEFEEAAYCQFKWKCTNSMA